jgi:hypothetical protein
MPRSADIAARHTAACRPRRSIRACRLRALFGAHHAAANGPTKVHPCERCRQGFQTLNIEGESGVGGRCLCGSQGRRHQNNFSGRKSMGPEPSSIEFNTEMLNDHDLLYDGVRDVVIENRANARRWARLVELHWRACAHPPPSASSTTSPSGPLAPPARQPPTGCAAATTRPSTPASNDPASTGNTTSPVEPGERQGVCRWYALRGAVQAHRQRR